MKTKSLVRITAAAAALMLVFAALPFSVIAAEVYPVNTPNGYNENDYQKVRVFLEITDPDGVKNGKN
ncbi:MAG: hypothetical protein J1E60_04150 [Christensenellaceae bacterium]|nr:hypothetical protein [Christensenellaceae bacterium]